MTELYVVNQNEFDTREIVLLKVFETATNSTADVGNGITSVTELIEDSSTCGQLDIRLRSKGNTSKQNTRVPLYISFRRM